MTVMSASSGNRPYHHGDLRSTLLRSAERTLREKGAAALSLRELARTAGVSHAAPSRHFKDKQALLDALALDGYDRLNTAMETANDPTLPLEPRLTSLARAYLTFAIDHPELLELMYTRKHEPDSAAQFTGAVDRSLATFLTLVTDAKSTGELLEADLASIMLLTAASLHGLAALVAAGAYPAEEVLAHLNTHIHLLLEGLRPR
ncbi:TetR/AcrR family transcriptional regulator [Streptomyces niveiscabiei]|uniref:TetR/AcrR family transcriptional regulator n=1 Tax=Streptomyces niveiscabiei TaxID=164115 RepID=UPI0029A84DAA|nr:TetR/AcrR family transcriptional regulator [Streptomyces niveiscabiei]MDX3388065.1 TetR/AcrR family transcriptional regulator [Streptomyces niveiscabiei]